MNDQYSFSNIDSLLFQIALETRELSQKKNEINQQIKVCRADIAERMSYIETICSNTKKLEEDIRVKQSTLINNKANAKRMKATNSLLLQYEQSLREELESRKASYKHDVELYEERITSYREIFLSHKEYYYKSPLAQKLLMLQAEKVEIESRIKACDDQIAVKRKELDLLTGPEASSSATEKLPDSVSGQQPTTESEIQLNPATEEDSHSSIDISALHLDQTKSYQDGHETSVEENAEENQEENNDQDATACYPSLEEVNSGQWSVQQLDVQRRQDVMHTEEQDQETRTESQEQQPTVSDMQETIVQEEMEERAAVEKVQAEGKEDSDELVAFPQPSSHETNPQSSPATVKAVPSTPMSPFNFSLGSSPHRGTSDTKSPAFLFSLNSEACTPGFSGFGFDVGSPQEEDSSFSFTGPFFNEKKTSETKTSSCPEFLFGREEQNEDFQFAFSAKSPQTADKNNTGDEFPFSFNF